MTQTRSQRDTQLALSLIAAALALLLVAPSALGFQTRTPLGFFGPGGPGACPGSTFATGTGDLSVATGSADTNFLATGTGDIQAFSTEVTNVTTTTGAFLVGESISNSLLFSGTTITAVGDGTLTLSQPAGAGTQANASLVSGSKTLTNVTTTSGVFTVGWSISGDGILGGTTITAVGADTLTLSTGVIPHGDGDTKISLTAGTSQISNVATSCGTFTVGQTIEGAGITNDTTITAVGASSLTLSHSPISAGVGVQLSAWPTFERAKGLAFNQANDKPYVLDLPFFSAQKTLHAFNAPANTPAGGVFPLSLNDAIAVAVDNTQGGSGGNIYVLQRSGGIVGLNSTGAPLGGNFPVIPAGGSANTSCDGAVDSAGNIWVSDNSPLQAIFRFDSAGNKLGQLVIDKGLPCELAFDSNDDLYVSIPALNPSDRGIWKYTAASGYKTATQVVNGSAGDIAIDRSTHTLYVVQDAAVAAYDLSGSLLYSFGIAGGEAQGVTVDESANRVYVAEGDRVRVYGALTEFPDATASPQPATDVGATKAELHATIDDNSALPTRWFFQLSQDDGLTWTDSCPNGPYGAFTEGGQSGLAVSCNATFLQSNTDYLFRVVTGKGAGSTAVASSTLSFKTDLIPPASATPNPATNITAESAELSATIDDNGPLPTAWRFEVSSDGGTTWAKPEGEVSSETGGGESGVAVSGTAKELEPNTEYRFRMVTKKDPGAPDEISSALSFSTLAVPPVVSDIGAVQITDTSATLAGEINPRNLQTSYVFEYGPTPALGSSTPPVDLGAANDILVVSQPIEGLQPDTTYYFKLVATNAAGAAESATPTLRTRADPLPLPDDRAYEQVSPPDKNLGNVGGGGTANVPVGNGWDGQGVAFGMFTGFGDPPGQIGFIETDYLSRRTPSGWRTHWLGEPQCTRSGGTTGSLALSPNLDRAVIQHSERASCPLPPLDPDAPDSRSNLYLGNYTNDPPTYQLLPPVSDVRGGSEDFSHLILSNSGQLTADAPGGNFAKLYDWNEGALSLISKDTANTPFATSSTAPGSYGGLPYAVSEGASRIFFVNGTEIYMRQNNTTTYYVSQSECTSACGPSAAEDFLRANPAGNKVLLNSTAKLTNEGISSGGGENLYLYTHSANPAVNANLTLLSKDNEAADGTASGLRGLLGMSDDGDTVFFSGDGQLVAGAPIADGAKLYRWQRNGGSPTLDYLATLDKTDSRVSSDSNPDGTYLLASTKARLNPGADHDKDRDTYRWDAQDGWLCISCQLPGVPSAGDAALDESRMSDDGKRVFFSAKDALLPADINGMVDVYEWHDGTVSLISTGLGSQGSKFVGASRSGDDVFFTTFEPLVGWDIDDNADVYDARVGVGFPEPPPTGASCEGEACRGPVPVAPAQAGAGSAAFEGPGNTGKSQPKGCPKGKARRKGRCVAKKQQSKKQRHHQRAKHNRRAGR